MPVTITSRRAFMLAVALAVPACRQRPAVRPLRLGTTTTVQQSGMLAVAESLWHGVPLATVIGPSGQILRSAAAGDLDVVLTHAPALEAKFLGNATAVERCPFVTSRFVVVGPAADPAGVRGARDAADALRRIAAQEATFVSRGDSSGTHERELALWRAAALAPWEGTRRSWYVESGADQTTTLRLADERRGYALADLPTLATLRDLALQPLFGDDTVLLNRYSITLVRLPTAHPEARPFFTWALDAWRRQVLAIRLADGTPAFAPSPGACVTSSQSPNTP
jgi:tungstate transport system substrate-binding protein